MGESDFQREHYDATVRPSFPEKAAIYFDKRISVIAAAGGFDGVDSVLDLGCGDGNFLRYITARYPSAACYGIDFSHSQVLHATTSGVAAHFVTGDATDAPFPDASFDLVLFNAILHHLDAIEPAIDEAVRLCKVGGRVVVIEPNRWNPLIILLSIVKTHERGQLRLSRRHVQRLLGEHLTITKTGWLNSLIYPCQKLPPASTLPMFHWLEDSPLFLPWFRSHFLIVAEKRPVVSSGAARDGATA